MTDCGKIKPYNMIVLHKSQQGGASTLSLHLYMEYISQLLKKK